MANRLVADRRDLPCNPSVTRVHGFRTRHEARTLAARRAARKSRSPKRIGRPWMRPATSGNSSRTGASASPSASPASPGSASESVRPRALASAGGISPAGVERAPHAATSATNHERAEPAPEIQRMADIVGRSHVERNGKLDGDAPAAGRVASLYGAPCAASARTDSANSGITFGAGYAEHWRSNRAVAPAASSASANA